MFEISSYNVKLFSWRIEHSSRIFGKAFEGWALSLKSHPNWWSLDHQIDFHRTKMNVPQEYSFCISCQEPEDEKNECSSGIQKWMFLRNIDFCISCQEPEDDHTHERSLFKSFPKQFMYEIPHDFLTKISGQKMHIHLEYWFCIWSEESEDGHTHLRSRFKSFKVSVHIV